MQAVKYRWENWEPFLILNNGKGFERFRLFDSVITARIGEKRCIGHFKKGTHVKCPNNAKVTSGYYCNECRLRDDFFLCVQCDGSECINPRRRDDCKEERYFVYLAAFDSLIKVGISMEFRILERLVEQGADMAAKIGVVKDGMLARALEQEIKKSIGVVDRVWGDKKHELIFGNPNNASISLFNAINRLRKTSFAQHMVYPEIYDFRKYYRLDKIYKRPKKFAVKENTEISGTVVAAKGNLIVLENDDYYTLNAHDLIGREMEITVQKYLQS